MPLPNFDITQALIGLLVLLFSLTVHEAAHAWSADHLGDSTARRLGRVSLNPLVHIDPIGTVVFPLIALTINLPLIGWAKPVPVSVGQLRGDWRRKFMIIAAAGPASNLVLAGLAAILLRFVSLGSTGAIGGGMAVGTQVESLLETAIVINVLLAVFNMIPVPPLDGGNVLSGLLTGSLAAVFDKLRPFGFLILYGLMLTGMLSTLIVPPARLLLAWLL